MDTHLQPINSDKAGRGTSVELAQNAEQRDDFARHTREADSFWSQFRKTGRLEDLDSAITSQQAALGTCFHSSADRSRTLQNLASLLRTRYERWGDLHDLERAVSMNREALALRPEGHPKHFTSLNSLANSLLARFRHGRTKDDLDECISLHRAALELLPEGHPDRSMSLNNIASSLWTRFEQERCVEDLEECISLHRIVLELLPGGHPNRSSSLSNIANALKMRFEESGKMEDLDECIALHRTALELRPEGHPDRSWSLDFIASSLLSRFEKGGRVEDLEESVNLHRAALELRPTDGAERSSTLKSLGNSLLARFQQGGQMEDLNESITLHRVALELLPKTHPNRFALLNNIASSVEMRFEQEGNIEDLEESITLHRSALGLLPEDHPDRSMSLNNLASPLLARFKRERRMEDLEECVILNRAALELRPEGHPLRSSSLNNLASSLLTRFEEAGRMEDLDECIALHRTALELWPKGHPKRCTSLNNVAISLQRRFEQRGRIEDLEESISLHYTALELRPESHPDRLSSLHSIANILLMRFRQGGSIEDFEKSVSMHRAALDLLPEGHPARSSLLNDIAVSFFTRFRLRGHKEDLDESIALDRAALELRPEGHPLRCRSLNNIAVSLSIRFELGGSMEDFEEAIDSFRRSTAHTFSHFSARITAAQKWITVARRFDHQTLPEAHRIALSLVQRSLTIRHTLSAQHNFLSSDSRFQKLALDAASYAIGKGDYPEAIEILEQGRALLWSQLRGFRSPLEQLSRTNKSLAEKFEVCSRRLEALIASSESRAMGPGVMENETRLSGAFHEKRLLDEKFVQLRRLHEEQEALIEEIRRVPGFENFLQAAPFTAIQQVASEGPVIVLNYSEYRCDALIVVSQDNNPCVCVPLDEEFHNDTAKLHEEFLRVRQKFKVFSCEYDEILQRVMKFLWDRVASKVVQKLKELGIKEESRIWWCPTSVLTTFPFHAAGPYEDANGKARYLLDDYISSYTPTLTSLINARSGIQSGKKRARMLFVGDTGLWSTNKERKTIIGIADLRKHMKSLVDNDATPTAVLETLQKVRLVHFACHGQLDEEPFNSSFALPGGKLTLLDIARANLPHAEFAFLSACHTAEQGPRYALDEALHLAAAMQFCGFRSVVGTMWQLLDWDGPFLADAVYKYLMRDLEDGEVRFKRGAAAVRAAALRLREYGEPDPKTGKLMTERWVNLVHIGA